tara:strand:+ start:972 stop:1142 length:171 start_codon:yes stop_codon:yes gene_type:complete
MDFLTDNTNGYKITINYDKGDKCICCNKVYNEPTTEKVKLETKKEYEKFIEIFLSK